MEEEQATQLMAILWSRWPFASRKLRIRDRWIPLEPLVCAVEMTTNSHPSSRRSSCQSLTERCTKGFVEAPATEQHPGPTDLTGIDALT